MIAFLVLKFQCGISKHSGSGNMDDFVSNTLQSNFCNFTMKFIGD